MSDNGFLEGQHRYTGKLLAAYIESHEVPLIIWGGPFAAGVVSKKLVVNTDWAATVLKFAGVAAPNTRIPDGRPLQDIVTGAVPERKGARIDGLYGLNEDAEAGEGAKRSNCFRSSEGGDRWIYCRHESGEEELYRLRGGANRAQGQNLLHAAGLGVRLGKMIAGWHAAMSCVQDCYFTSLSSDRNRTLF
jgi:hypothetical protein